MKYWPRFFALLFVAVFFCAVGAVQATEDVPDYQLSIDPGFKLTAKSYGLFETPEYAIEAPVNNLHVAVGIDKAPEAICRSYARFKNARTGKWNRYKEFEGEFHYGDFDPISAWQVIFVIRDETLGTTAINSVAVRGVSVPLEVMEYLAQPPVPFKSLKAWPKPSIVSREEWKARPPKNDYTSHTPLRIVVHHSWVPAQAQYTGAATIRGIQNYHMDGETTKWTDIGYHFLIGHDGKIYQGRPETVVGAHASPNTNAVGICCIGNYDPNADKVTPELKKSLVNLLSWLSSKYGIDPKTQYFGHRDFSTKSCPGDMIYNNLPQYRQEVLDNIGTKK